MPYAVTRQSYWPDGQLAVEVAGGDSTTVTLTRWQPSIRANSRSFVTLEKRSKWQSIFAASGGRI
jgi:hypothetical protein